MSAMSSSPRSMATTLAWKAVGVQDSLRSTWVTGQTSRQNLCPDEKQLYEALRHSSTKARVFSSAGGDGRGAASTSGDCASPGGFEGMPGVKGCGRGRGGVGGAGGEGGRDGGPRPAARSGRTCVTGSSVVAGVTRGGLTL